MAINVCASIGNNIGRTKCDVKMQRAKYLLLTGYEFTKEELKDSDSFKAAIKRQMLKPNNDPGKIFVSPKINQSTDNTGDPNVATLSDGYEEVLNEATPKYVYDFSTGVCQHQAFAGFSGWAGGNYRIDKANVLWYRTKENGGGKPWSTPNLYVDPPRDGSSSNISVGKARITLDIDEFKSNVGAVKLDFNIADLVNLVDVQLEDREDDYDSPSTSTNVFYIGGKVVCQGEDIYDTLKAALTNVNRWKIENLTRSTVLVIDSVGTDDTKKAWKPVVNSASWATVQTDDKVRVTLVDPATLAAAGITGIEAGHLVFTKK